MQVINHPLRATVVDRIRSKPIVDITPADFAMLTDDEQALVIGFIASATARRQIERRT